MFCPYFNPCRTCCRNLNRQGIDYIPQQASDFISTNIPSPESYEDYNKLLDNIKNLKPEMQLILLKEKRRALEQSQINLGAGSLFSEFLIVVAIYIATKYGKALSFKNVAIAGSAPAAKLIVSQEVKKSSDQITKIKEAYDRRLKELKYEIAKIKMEEIKSKQTPTPLAYKFISSLEDNINTYVKNKNMYEQKQKQSEKQLENLNKLYVEAKTVADKDKIKVQIDSKKAEIENIKSAIKALKDNVTAVLKELNSNHTLNSKSLATAGMEYYPWIFDLNEKIKQLDIMNYPYTKDSLEYISPILNLAKEIANGNLQKSSSQNLSEKETWEMANTELQSLFDLQTLKREFLYQPATLEKDSK